MTTERFDRQLRLFGSEGQAKIAGTGVAVVGLGGVGSHVVQQLAYLGVRSFRLIDRDTVSMSNLNRLIGATPCDVTTQQHKVAITERMIKAIDPEIDVVVVQNSFVSDEGYAHLLKADVVFGCVDHDAPRLILTEFCQAYGKPYFDIATDIGQDGQLWFGGRVLYSVNGEMCLLCKGMLEQEVLKDAFSSENQRAEDERIYGVPRRVLRGRGPSVVSLNGMLASIAVTEFMVEVTGIRQAYRALEYNGRMGRLVVDRDPPMPDCYYCKYLRGEGDRADVQRYIREGWGDHL